MRNRLNKILDSKYYRIFDTVVFILAFLLAAVSSLVLFYRQSIYAPGPPWPSDIKPYIEEMLGTNTEYVYPYPILFSFAKIINYFAPTPELAMVIACTILNAVAIIITKVVLDKYTGSKLLSTGCTISLFFLSMIYGSAFEKFGILNRMRGVGTPNPWHNHTYIAARPFMILAFVFGAITLAVYEKEFAKDYKLTSKDIVKYALFALSLLLTTMTKPSYTLVHMGTFGLIMVYRFFKNKCKTFKQTILLGICYIPTIADLLYQYFATFTGVASTGEEQGMGIGLFRVWSHSCNNIPLAIVLGLAFPLVVLLFHWKDLKTDNIFRLSWQYLLMSFVMVAILYEKGFRENHGNFFWGYHCGQFFVFLTGMIMVIRDTLHAINEGASKKDIIILCVEWILLAVHTIMGLWYFYLLTAFGITYM